MKQSAKMIALLSAFSLSMGLTQSLDAQKKNLRSFVPPVVEENAPLVDSTLFVARELDDLLSAIDTIQVDKLDFNKVNGPWIFTGFRHINANRKYDFDYTPNYPGLSVATNDTTEKLVRKFINRLRGDSTYVNTGIDDIDEELWVEEEVPAATFNVTNPEYTPEWLLDAVTQMRRQEDLMYASMITRPKYIDFAYWDLPVPPTLPDDDVTLMAYIRKLDLPEVETDKAILPEEVVNKIHWLHTFNAFAQFSQAFVSDNWYQGGNNHLALLLGANWNVQLNQVYHPNLLFQSNLSYKLGLNSTPQDQVHDYSISEDVLQWNLNTGLKAFQKWYYSFNAQFKTQIFKNYKSNSNDLKASFLSPGDFNLGLGMSYSLKKNNIEFTATISPLSYNLKTCINNLIDHAQFNIKPTRSTHSEIGSNAEFNMNWKIRYNINYKTRLFLFTDYSYFLGDWEHTFNFDINKFLSTQIYVHMRYDTSSETNSSWKHFMLREVLSFGLSYTFSTK